MSADNTDSQPRSFQLDRTKGANLESFIAIVCAAVMVGIYAGARALVPRLGIPSPTPGTAIALSFGAAVPVVVLSFWCRDRLRWLMRSLAGAAWTVQL